LTCRGAPDRRRIGEITYLLRFSESSNFTRAFKRWTGKSPAQYRMSV
jgi:AraC-like DNA-binding protein